MNPAHASCKIPFLPDGIAMRKTSLPIAVFALLCFGIAHADECHVGSYRLADGRAIDFDDYPNAFERIAGVLDLDKSGEIWVTAKPGCEFEVPGGEAHAGGASHGALHALDSHSPVIIAGAGAPRRLPSHMRSVDIAPICMDILGVPMRYKVGDPRK